jgi:tRNA threonylcarbamoyladenosine biosynthesis protein TsaB
VITFAIEQSSCCGSVAIREDAVLRLEKTWDYVWPENQQLFSVLPGLLDESGVNLADVDVFAAGLGPGSFAGTRTAVSVANALALPGKTRTCGISSGEALAWNVFKETGADKIVVLGDARRKRVWYAHFVGNGGALSVKKDWALAPFSELNEVLIEGSVVVTPDWSRIAEPLSEACPASAQLIGEARYPAACAVAELAAAKLAAGLEPGPMTPLYMHPPVFVKPKSYGLRRPKDDHMTT